MKGKFIKPTLKKVSKYENKFAKLQKGSQVRVREPAQSQGQVEVLSFHPTPINTHKNILLAQCIDINHQNVSKLSSPFVGSLHTAGAAVPHFSKQQQQDPRARTKSLTPNIILRMRKQD